VALANHVLYYVDDVGATLAALRDTLDPAGRLAVAIAGWDNPLVGIWKTAFALLERPMPYHVGEDVEQALIGLGAGFQKSRVPYRLRFPDTAENRTRILRFLLADHLAGPWLERLLAEFDPFARRGQVEMETHSYHFLVGR
jgi:trans-aconitate 2-methyltransferase